MRVRNIKKLHLSALELLGKIEIVTQEIKIQKDNVKRWEFGFFYTKESCQIKIDELKKKRRKLERSYDVLLAEIFNQVNK